jgi:hypothetical protein
VSICHKRTRFGSEGQGDLVGVERLGVGKMPNCYPLNVTTKELYTHGTGKRRDEVCIKNATKPAANVAVFVAMLFGIKG